MRYPSLIAAACALGLLGVSGLLAARDVHRFEADHERRAAQYFLPQKLQGDALQQLAFKMPHFLPIYGSSELGSSTQEKGVDSVPGKFFASAPTGFTAFPVGRAGTTPLIILQDLAAMGPIVRGHKVVVVLSPSWFVRPMLGYEFAGNVSALHVGESLFGGLDDDLKHRLATRLLQFATPLDNFELLRIETHLYAEGTPTKLWLAHCLRPVGQFWLEQLRVLDDFATVLELGNMDLESDPAPAVAHRHIDWKNSEAQAERLTDHRKPDASPPSEPKTKARDGTPLLPPPAVAGATEPEHPMWGDYELLLETLQKLGAHALILSIPENAVGQDRSAEAARLRQIYRARVTAEAAQHGFKAVTFKEHEDDPSFRVGNGDHLSERGWIFFDQTINAFYHDKL